MTWPPPSFPSPSLPGFWPPGLPGCSPAGTGYGPARCGPGRGGSAARAPGRDSGAPAFPGGPAGGLPAKPPLRHRSGPGGGEPAGLRAQGGVGSRGRAEGPAAAPSAAWLSRPGCGLGGPVSSLSPRSFRAARRGHAASEAGRRRPEEPQPAAGAPGPGRRPPPGRRRRMAFTFISLLLAAILDLVLLLSQNASRPAEWPEPPHFLQRAGRGAPRRAKRLLCAGHSAREACVTTGDRDRQRTAFDGGQSNGNYKQCLTHSRHNKYRLHDIIE